MKQLFFILSLSPIFCFAQDTSSKASSKTIVYSIGFKDSIIKLARNPKKDNIVEISLKGLKLNQKDLEKGKCFIEINQQETTAPLNSFTLINKEFLYKDFGNAQDSSVFFIKLLKDALPDRKRIIILNILEVLPKDTAVKVTFKNSDTNRQKLRVEIDEIKSDSIVGYNYLGYIGTNFDLVDGVQAKNLFFATNILVINPGIERKMGGYVSLYGNRSLTDVDTSSNTMFSTKKQINDTFYKYSNQARLSRTRVFDNLGASMNPMYKITRKSTNLIDVYGAGYLEFVWRRGTINTQYSDFKTIDSTAIKGSTPDTYESAPQNKEVKFNQYDFYMGLGLIAIHETPKISVRLFLNLAYHASFVPQNLDPNIINSYYSRKPADLAFVGRLWITEPHSGITLQAEVLNNLINPQPYYGVTLSKAFNLENFGTFLAPVTAR